MVDGARIYCSPHMKAVRPFICLYCRDMIVIRETGGDGDQTIPKSVGSRETVVALSGDDDVVVKENVEGCGRSAVSASLHGEL